MKQHRFSVYELPTCLLSINIMHCNLTILLHLYINSALAAYLSTESTIYRKFSEWPTEFCELFSNLNFTFSYKLCLKLEKKYFVYAMLYNVLRDICSNTDSSPLQFTYTQSNFVLIIYFKNMIIQLFF